MASGRFHRGHMNPLFSERNGHRPPAGVPQFNGMDGPLRDALWKAFYIECGALLSGYGSGSHRSRAPLCGLMCRYVIDVGFSGPFRKNWDDHEMVEFFKGRFYDLQWWQVYDLVEFILRAIGPQSHWAAPHETARVCRAIQLALDRHNAGYSLVGTVFVPASSVPECDSIAQALGDGKLPQVQQHISAACQYAISDQEMDWRNAVKESVSAVESIVQFITGDHSSGVASQIAAMRNSKKIHAALGEQVVKFYGWASDVARHSLKEGDPPDAPVSIVDARYSVSTACSIVNLLKLKFPSECGLK